MSNSPNGGRTRSKSTSSPLSTRYRSINGGQTRLFDNYSDDGSDAGGAYYSLLSDIGGIPMKRTNPRHDSPRMSLNGDQKYGTMINDGSSTEDNIAHHQMHWLTLQFVDSDIEQTFAMQHADKWVAHDRAFFIVVAIAAILDFFYVLLILDNNDHTALSATRLVYTVVISLLCVAPTLKSSWLWSYKYRRSYILAAYNIFVFGAFVLSHDLLLSQFTSEFYYLLVLMTYALSGLSHVVGTCIAFSMHVLAILLARFLPDGGLQGRTHDFVFALVCSVMANALLFVTLFGKWRSARQNWAISHQYRAMEEHVRTESTASVLSPRLGGGLDFEAPISKVVRYLRSLQHGPIASHLSHTDKEHLDYSVNVLTSANDSMFVPDLSNQIRSLTADFHATKQRNAALAAAAAASANNGAVAVPSTDTGGRSSLDSTIDASQVVQQPGSSSSAALSDTSPHVGATVASTASLPDVSIAMDRPPYTATGAGTNGTSTHHGIMNDSSTQTNLTLATQLPERKDLTVIVPTTPEVRVRSVTTAPAAVTAGQARAAGRGRTPVAGLVSPAGMSLPPLSSVPSPAKQGQQSSLQQSSSQNQLQVNDGSHSTPAGAAAPGRFNFRRADSARSLLGHKETKAGTTPVGGWRSLPGALTNGISGVSSHDTKENHGRPGEKSRRARTVGGRGHNNSGDTTNANATVGVGTVLDEETVKWVEQELASTSPAVESPIYARTKVGSPESRRRSEVESKAKEALGPSERRRSMSFMSRLKTLDEQALGRVLSNMSQLDFDIFELHALTHGQPLSFLAHACMQKFDLFNKLNIPEKAMHNFLEQIESGYRDNPYHAAVHSADVLQTCLYFTAQGVGALLSDLDVLLLIISAAIHDYDHPGVNNAFLISTGHQLALQYNDRSVLENHHVSAAFRVLQREECSFLSRLPVKDQRETRDALITLILATDLSHHLEFVGRFKRQAPGSKPVDGPDTGPLGKGFDPAIRSDKLMVLQMTLKAADIGHSIKKLPLHLEWSRRITEEFFLQGDRERALGIPIGPFNDRMHTNVAKSQIGFLDFVVSPCYNVWAEYLGNIQETTRNLGINRAHWLAEVDKPRTPIPIDTSLSPAARSRASSESKDSKDTATTTATSPSASSSVPTVASTGPARAGSRPGSAERRLQASSGRLSRVGSPVHMAITLTAPGEEGSHQLRGSPPPTLTSAIITNGVPLLAPVAVNMATPATASLSPKGPSSRAASTLGGSTGSLKKSPSHPRLAHHDSSDSGNGSAATTPTAATHVNNTNAMVSSSSSSQPSSPRNTGRLATAIADATSSSTSNTMSSHGSSHDLARVNEGDEDTVSPHQTSQPIAISGRGSGSSRAPVAATQVSLSGLVVEQTPSQYR